MIRYLANIKYLPEKIILGSYNHNGKLISFRYNRSDIQTMKLVWHFVTSADLPSGDRPPAIIIVAY